MLTSKQVTKVVKYVGIQEMIEATMEKEGLDFIERLNRNVFMRVDEKGYARLATQPDGVKTLKGYVPLCSIDRGYMMSKLA